LQLCGNSALHLVAAVYEVGQSDITQKKCLEILVKVKLFESLRAIRFAMGRDYDAGF